MSHQSVPAGNGLQWLTEAVQLVLRNPGPFALMGLIVAVIAVLPMVGSLALVVLGPALYGGIMFAARERQAGRPADFQHLFQAFREEGKLVKMILLCLPGIIAGVAIVALAVVMFGGAILAAMGTGSAESAMGAGLGLSALLFVPLAIAIGLASFALTFFATPNVMLGGAEPIAAMKDSLAACLANLGAVLLFLILMAGAVVVLSLVLIWIPLLGQLAVTTVVVPVFCVASFLAWRQVYLHDITQEVPAPAPPPPPSLEA